MALIFVDVEARGPCPSLGWMTEFGAVEYESEQTFHGKLFVGDDRHAKRLDQLPDGEARKVFEDFERWLLQFSGKPTFVSDNPAFDWMWVCDAFWRLLGRNPFGHSARRISDFYAGLMGDFRQTQGWKHYRTVHDHDPVHDAQGNLAAFKKVLELYGAK